MNGADTRDRGRALPVVAERQRQHRRDRVMQPYGRLDGAAAKRAVLDHARGDQGMRQLHQDGPRPPEQHHPFRVNALDDHCSQTLQ
jgi:hypothetical protein